jgi:hypothetical protein
MVTQSLVLRVLLDSEKKEDIYRDIKISPTSSFQNLSDAILQAFAFTGNEAASFVRVTRDWEPMANEDYDSMSDSDLPTMEIQQEMFVDSADSPHMGNTLLHQVLRKVGSNILYTYDLLKNWRFLLVVTEILEEETAQPEVVLIHGEAPSEESKEIDFNFDNMAKNERSTAHNAFDDDEDDEFADGWMDEYETDDY